MAITKNWKPQHSTEWRRMGKTIKIQELDFRLVKFEISIVYLGGGV